MNEQIQNQIKWAVQLLRNEEVIGLPTETVYGLAADICSEKALKRIFSIKKRPFFDPLIVHVSSINQAKSCVTEWPIWAQVLAEKFWPGPLTIVLDKNNTISDTITSGLTTVGLRWPNHQVAQEIIKQLGSPLAAPSANMFGRTSPTTSEHVKSEFNNQVFVVDSNPCEIGIESTIVLIRNNSNISSQIRENVNSLTKSNVNEQNNILGKISILRKGWITKQDIESALSSNLNWQWQDTISKPMAPGQMKHHYMPVKPLVVIKSSLINLELHHILEKINKKFQFLPDEIEGVKINKPNQPLSKPINFNLGHDAQLAARKLYSELRDCDSQLGDFILCKLGPEISGEVWESILDRLYKAASVVLE